jgi:5'-methylthioadenosine phosphorylase
MKPGHILAKPEDIAEKVIIAGDPARIKQVSKMLHDSVLVNSNRGLLTFTGYYEDTRITIATHGIGAPSAAIVIEELYMLGARIIVRLGSFGSFIKDVKTGHIAVPTAAAYMPGGTVGAYILDKQVPALPSREVLNSILDIAKEERVKVALGPVISSDSFYSEDPDFIETWTSLGMIGVEMECATLFILGKLRGFRTGSMLVAADNLLLDDEKIVVPAEKLRESVETAGRIILRALTQLPK